MLFGFIEPLHSTKRSQIENNLYRKCYWYYIKDNILNTKKILDEEKNNEYTKLDKAVSVIYNHLCIEKEV
tara:strand:- start:67 stop:276 length:210 start_codon:yes stop_codon:yes gene_type:complete